MRRDLRGRFVCLFGTSVAVFKIKLKSVITVYLDKLSIEVFATGESTILRDSRRKDAFLSVGFGHGLMALTESEARECIVWKENIERGKVLRLLTICPLQIVSRRNRVVSTIAAQLSSRSTYLHSENQNPSTINESL